MLSFILVYSVFFFLMIRRPPRSTLFPTRRSSDLDGEAELVRCRCLGPALHLIGEPEPVEDRKSTRLNSSHTVISYAVFCLKKKKKKTRTQAEARINT